MEQRSTKSSLDLHWLEENPYNASGPSSPQSWDQRFYEEIFPLSHINLSTTFCAHGSSGPAPSPSITTTITLITIELATLNIIITTIMLITILITIPPSPLAPSPPQSSPSSLSPPLATSHRHQPPPTLCPHHQP
ncbi:hypothetical protein WISP_70626 [Willisornis vidua]|uniref:Uncharacterized protein n=1 Tax=Willisornis vidua TaxID=1566151 RepID=A0ABQ9D8E5_9PASS|nr:hypothetical protein WISP_70626 [Willisornis vidua]